MSAIDDGTIPDDAGLLRRIHPDQVVEDKNEGKRRPSSAAFKDPKMSVDAEPILRVHGYDWQFTLAAYPGYSLVRFEASAARSRQLSVIHDPLPENPAHTIVDGKKTASVANHLRDASEWVHLEPQ